MDRSANFGSMELKGRESITAGKLNKSLHLDALDFLLFRSHSDLRRNIIPFITDDEHIKLIRGRDRTRTQPLKSR